MLNDTVVDVLQILVATVVVVGFLEAQHRRATIISLHIRLVAWLEARYFTWSLQGRRPVLSRLYWLFRHLIYPRWRAERANEDIVMRRYDALLEADSGGPVPEVEVFAALTEMGVPCIVCPRRRIALVQPPPFVDTAPRVWLSIVVWIVAA